MSKFDILINLSYEKDLFIYLFKKSNEFPSETKETRLFHKHGKETDLNICEEDYFFSRCQCTLLIDYSTTGIPIAKYSPRSKTMFCLSIKY